VTFIDGETYSVNKSSLNQFSFKNLILNSPGNVIFVFDSWILPAYSNNFGGFIISTSRNSSAMDFVNNPLLKLKVNAGTLNATLNIKSK
jgi:hypothetical protein